MTCAVTTSVLGCLVTSYLFFRYIFILPFGITAKIMLLLLFWLIGCLPLAVGYRFENLFGAYYPFYRYALYFIFIGSIILLTVTLVADAGCLIAYKAGWLGKIVFSAKLCIKYNLVLIAVATGLTIGALIAGTKIPSVKQVDISTNKINQNKTIAVLTDIHIHRVINPQKVQAIVEKTNALKPDIIVLVGDIIDDDVNKIKDITPLLKELKAKDGIYFVTGNHEYYAGYQATTQTLKNLGFMFLENSGINLGNIYLAGVPDLSDGRFNNKFANLKKAFAHAKPEQYKILLSHRPSDFGAETNFDLQISGHTHGGQIFPFHILTLWFNKYLAGLYDMANGAKIYVSRGAGQWGPQMRFLAPSEISLIKLKREDN